MTGRWPDFMIFAVVLILAIIGIAVQYSSANGYWVPWAAKQSWYLGISSVVLLAAYRWPEVKSLSYKIYGLSVVLLIVVAIAGETKMGATRWINLGIMRFQPSELAKISTLLAISRYISDMSISNYSPVRFFVVPILLVLLPTSLVFVQPHLGNSILIFTAGLAVIFVAGFSARAIWIILSLSLPCIPIVWCFLLLPYQKTRIISFMNPEQDPLGAGYNVIQSEIAVGSGGLWGKGFLEGSQAHLGFLPEKHTDFVFTIIAEEFGLAGCLVVLTLYAMLFSKLNFIISSTQDKFTRLSVFGIYFSLYFQVMINIFMVLGLMPVVGVPLPFISHGGSSLLISMLCIGIACNLRMQQQTRA